MKATDTPKFNVGDKVRIKMMGANSAFKLGENGRIQMVGECYDGHPKREDYCEPEEECGHLFQVEVTEGDFTPHMRGSGKLHCWDYELELDPNPH